jgi:hypothetical protein
MQNRKTALHKYRRKTKMIAAINSKKEFPAKLTSVQIEIIRT